MRARGLWSVDVGGRFGRGGGGRELSPSRLRSDAMRFWRHSDEGSGTMNGVTLIAVIGVLMSVVAVGGNLMITATHAQSAADQAAIAGAEAAWREVAVPCLNSVKAARLNGGELTSCSADDQDVTVEVRVKTSVPIVRGITRKARAGPVDCS